MKKLILILALAGCAPLPPAPPGPVSLPQAAEQCQAQPELDWC